MTDPTRKDLLGSKLRPFEKIKPPVVDDVWGLVSGKDDEGLITDNHNVAGRYCANPDTWLEVDSKGNCRMCCPSWLPNIIGNLFEESLDAIWNGVKAKLIRASIMDGSYRYCNHAFCPFIAQNSLPFMPSAIPDVKWPSVVNFTFDESCNLSCPSCRISKVILTSGSEYERRKLLLDMIVGQMFSEPHDQAITLNITGSGDPFGSKIFREFLFNFDPTPWPNLKLILVTNGVMMTPTNLRRMAQWLPRLDTIRISFDAATEETYQEIRRGGDWKLLLENCDHLNELIKTLPQRVRVATHFVVQDLNFREMPSYAKLIRKRFPNFRAIHFSLVKDWATWDRDTYFQRAIWKPDHPNHQEFLDILDHKQLKHRRVHLGNVNSVRR